MVQSCLLFFVYIQVVLLMLVLKDVGSRRDFGVGNDGDALQFNSLLFFI